MDNIGSYGSTIGLECQRRRCIGACWKGEGRGAAGV